MLPGGGGNPTPREVDWTLDLLGNWAGTTTPAAPGRKITGPLNGEPTDTTHSTDWFNRIGSLVQSGGSGGSSSTAYVYDGAGNLVCDGPGAGAFFYQYDAWNRLVQISLSAARPQTPTSAAEMCMLETRMAPAKQSSRELTWMAEYA